MTLLYSMFVGLSLGGLFIGSGFCGSIEGASQRRAQRLRYLGQLSFSVHAGVSCPSLGQDFPVVFSRDFIAEIERGASEFCESGLDDDLVVEPRRLEVTARNFRNGKEKSRFFDGGVGRADLPQQLRSSHFKPS